MKVKRPTRTEVKAAIDAGQPQGKLSMGGSWGGTVKQTMVPSGAKLAFEEDSDCVLKFIGVKDISDKMGRDPGEVIYNTFFDGKRLVSAPSSYAMSQSTFIIGLWYYLHCVALIPSSKNPSFNPMKDFEIHELGCDGESVQCPDRISDDNTLILRDAVIAELNYTRLNYPLR